MLALRILKVFSSLHRTSHLRSFEMTSIMDSLLASSGTFDAAGGRIKSNVISTNPQRLCCRGRGETLCALPCLLALRILKVFSSLHRTSHLRSFEMTSIMDSLLASSGTFDAAGGRIKSNVISTNPQRLCCRGRGETLCALPCLLALRILKVFSSLHRTSHLRSFEMTSIMDSLLALSRALAAAGGRIKDNVISTNLR